MRATWDALQPLVTFPGGRVPLRPADRFSAELWIDDEVLDDLLQEVADRAGYTLDQTEANPYYGNVVTIGDFVKFITLQPRRQDGGA